LARQLAMRPSGGARMSARDRRIGDTVARYSARLLCGCFALRTLVAERIASVSWLSWDHNAYYHRLLLRQLPHGCDRVMDVGCGAGAFAVELAARCRHVDALDRSPQMIELAAWAVPSNVDFVLTDVVRDPLPSPGYDAIVSISALHHLPLEQALDKLSAAVRSGGVLAVIALPRRDLPRELSVEILAAIAHRLFGAVFAALRTVGPRRWYALPGSHAVMPVVLDPPLTTRQVRRQAAGVLPGVRVRRLVFWRYLLVWHKPLETAASHAQRTPRSTRGERRRATPHDSVIG
jgi:ubiquinone/menaquinone biosynthesis C-methylase UbiE